MYRIEVTIIHIFSVIIFFQNICIHSLLKNQNVFGFENTWLFIRREIRDKIEKGYLLFNAHSIDFLSDSLSHVGFKGIKKISDIIYKEESTKNKSRIIFIVFIGVSG